MRERLRRFNEDRTRMVAAMSHDLRTPLTRLRMRIEMAEGLADQQKMLDELDMMNGMVESILSFARGLTLEAGGSIAGRSERSGRRHLRGCHGHRRGRRPSRDRAT